MHGGMALAGDIDNVHHSQKTVEHCSQQCTQERAGAPIFVSFFWRERHASAVPPKEARRGKR